MTTKVEATKYNFLTGVDQPHYTLMQKIEKTFSTVEIEQGIEWLNYEKCRVIISQFSNLVPDYYNRLYRITMSNGTRWYGKVSNIVMIADGCVEVELDIDYWWMYMYVDFGIENTIWKQNLAVTRSSYPNTKALITEDPNLKDYIKSYPFEKNTRTVSVLRYAQNKKWYLGGGKISDHSDSTLLGALSRQGLYAVFLMDLSKFTEAASADYLIREAIIYDDDIGGIKYWCNILGIGSSQPKTSTINSVYLCFPVMSYYTGVRSVLAPNDTHITQLNNVGNTIYDINNIVSTFSAQFQGYFYGPPINIFRHKYVFGKKNDNQRGITLSQKVSMCLALPSLWGINKKLKQYENVDGVPTRKDYNDSIGYIPPDDKYDQYIEPNRQFGSEIGWTWLPETYTWEQPDPKSDKVSNYYVASQLKAMFHGSEVNLGLAALVDNKRFYPNHIFFNGKFMSFWKEKDSGVELSLNYSHQVPYAIDGANLFFQANQNSLDTGLAQAATSGTIGALLQEKTYVGASAVNTAGKGFKTWSTLSTGFPITSMIGQMISGAFGVASNLAKRKDVKNSGRPELLATQEGMYASFITNWTIANSDLETSDYDVDKNITLDWLLRRDPECVKYVNDYVYHYGYYGVNNVKLDYPDNVSNKVCYFEITDDMLMIKLQKHIWNIYNNLPTTNAINTLYNLLNEGVRIWKVNPKY